jgi:putative endonuclease
VIPQDHYAVYIVSNNTRTTLYIGVTSDPPLRLQQHRDPQHSSFAARYHCGHLVFYEVFREIGDAIAREKQLKGWRREKKNVLIAKMNPNWDDLARDWFD